MNIIKESRDLLAKIFVVGGLFGFIYEEIFYFFDLGKFVKRGITFGPWIPIYAFGAVLIYLFCFKIKDKPLYIFLVGTIVSGILEFVVGYLLYHIGGIRLWDYSVEILNFGNIGGYVCLRSVLFFGISGLILFFIVVPLLEFINKKYDNSINNYITYGLLILFGLDIVISSILFII